MNDSYLIKGGRPLKGRVVLSGAKNVALKTIIAALMFEGPVVLDNIPRINDVIGLIKLIKSLGAEAEFVGKNRVRLDGRKLNINKVDLLQSSKIRVSFMLFAPLLYRFHHCYVPNPGGCRIGARPIDRIVAGMKKLGISVKYNSGTGYYLAKLEGSIGGEYLFEKTSHTGTELLMLLALMTDREVVIDNAASEPEIDDLVLFLNLAGANIKKFDSRIVVKKSLPLKQKEPYSIITDRNEFVTYATLAVASGGDIIIGPIDENLVATFLKTAGQAGCGIEKIEKNNYRFFYAEIIKPMDIETSPHPGFMTDWQPSFAILMLKAKGESIIRERVFENRFAYVEELKKLGTKIEFVKEKVPDPGRFYFFNYKRDKTYQQTIKITGGLPLHNAILNIFDLRAGAAVACAALLARGESVVLGASILERGYENFVEKISKLGGDIKRI